MPKVYAAIVTFEVIVRGLSLECEVGRDIVRGRVQECQPRKSVVGETPNGGKFWAAKVLRLYVMDDVYRPHSREELKAMVAAGQMSAEVFRRLDPQRRYGIWWFNRRRTRRTQVLEAGAGGERPYKKKSRYVCRPKEE
jgi:hypothetical protein